MNKNRMFQIEIVVQAIIAVVIVAYILFSLINPRIQYDSLKKQYFAEFSEVTKDFKKDEILNFVTINSVLREEDIKMTLVRLSVHSESNKEKINKMRTLVNEIIKNKNRRDTMEAKGISESFSAIVVIKELGEKYGKNESKSDTEVKEDSKKLINAYKIIYLYRDTAVSK